MIAKNGFLLIELMISSMLVFFIIFIIAHYIIEIKNIQQEALIKTELLSTARNFIEKIIAFQNTMQLLDDPNFTINLQEKEIFINNEKNKQKISHMITIFVEPKKNFRMKSCRLYAYILRSGESDEK